MGKAWVKLERSLTLGLEVRSTAYVGGKTMKILTRPYSAPIAGILEPRN